MNTLDAVIKDALGALLFQQLQMQAKISELETALTEKGSVDEKTQDTNGRGPEPTK